MRANVTFSKDYKRIVAIVTLEAELQDRAKLLRSTAAELRAGTMNPFHAANRIERIANEIARPKDSSATT